MMRQENPTESICVHSLAELDAVVGKHLTEETPRVHWVDTHTHFQFESVEEAVESVDDPFFRQFVYREGPATTVLMEVREFRPYSSDLDTAWELVAHLTHVLEPFVVQRNGLRWQGAFGKCAFISADTASAVICLAALRARGIEVECRLEQPSDPADAGVPGAQIKSYYSRP